MSEKFNDPLLELIHRHEQSDPNSTAAETTETPIQQPETDNVPVTEILKDVDVETVPDEYNPWEDDVIDDVTKSNESNNDIDYGDNDLKDEIESEEKIENENRAKEMEQRLEDYRESNKSIMPPNPGDKSYHDIAFGFQAEKLAIVTTMVNKVIAKHHIISGGIPDDIKMPVMGELIDIYHQTGEEITPEFEAIILNNWKGGETEKPQQNENNQTDESTEQSTPDEENKEDDKKTTININVEPNTPVTVNIDGEMLNEEDRKHTINVVVHEVSETEMRTTTVIENSQLEGIITPYESSSTDVPLALPMSAYRCTMCGASLFDIIKLSSIDSGNERDADIKTWTMLYNHLKNPSIGEFKSFEDFLKHTDYRDMELLLWGMFVATADETEVIHFECANEKCKHRMEVRYNPREILHVNTELVPEHYMKTGQVASGKAAVEHWENIHSQRKIYELPNSKLLVELDDYTAYDYHNIKMPIMDEVYHRYRQNGNMELSNLSEAEAQEMNFLLLFLLYIKSITIRKGDTSYRYTNWRDIERIVTTHIGNKDISILISIINQTKNTPSPISFYLNDVKCPKCGRTDEKIPVDNIMRSLFFQLQSGLSNTSINFVETDKI